MTTSTDILKTNKQKLLNAFPELLRQDVEIVMNFFSEKDLSHTFLSEQEIILDGQKLIVPGRVYFDDPNKITEKHLTFTQQTILNCIYLRHHNGFVRQQKLEKLIGNTDDYFVIPYIFQLLWEYVMEILEVAHKHINHRTINKYLKFFSENPRYRQQTESRMISYWNVYYRKYRKYEKLDDYIGWKIFDQIRKEELKVSVRQHEHTDDSYEHLTNFKMRNSIKDISLS